MAARMKGGQAVVRALEAHGVEVAFGIPGVHTLEIYDALIDSSIRHVLARHEQGAGYMADGYARASGRPGVALVITGPGVTNVTTAIGEAYTDSSPVLVVSSNVERQWAGRMLGHLHDLKDQLGVMSAVTKWNARAGDVADVPRLIAEAFSRMTTGRPRPTHVEVPLDVLGTFGDAEIEPPAPAPALPPEPGVVARAAAMLADARRVVVYAGGGVVSAGASEALRRVVERLGAPVLTSMMGKGAIPEDHPLALGNLWEPGNPTEEVLRAADVALVVGSKLGAQDTDYQRMPLPERIVRIDIDPEEIERNYRATHAVVADARLALEALDAALADRGVAARGWTGEEVGAIRQRALGQVWGRDKQPYVDALRAAIPRQGILVNDMTMMSYVALRRYPVYEPRTFFFPAGYGTLGFSLPAAIGAKLARPEKTVVAVVGDGGYQFTMQELATAVQFKVGLPIVIFNDSTYTAVKDAQAREFDRRFVAVDLVNPDYVKLAEAYGIPGVRARSPEELHAAIVEAARREGPTLIDTPIHFDY